MWRRVPAFVPIGLWLVVAGAAWSSAARHEEGVLGGLAAALRLLDGHPGAPLFLLLAYALRPLTLLPVTVLTAFAGFLLGPWLGFAVALLAVTSSSLLPYALARAARRHGVGGSRRPFQAVLIARLAMLPGDAVSAVAGALRVPPTAFVLATLLGGAPGVLVGVLAGAGVEEAFELGAVRPDLRLLAASLVVVVMSLGVAWLLRRSPAVAAIER
jgi:uncharacterized membrane protein YdjX (TVP38/TMEM64 family)